MYMNFHTSVSLLEENIAGTRFPLHNLLYGIPSVIPQDSQHWFYNACNHIVNTELSYLIVIL